MPPLDYTHLITPRNTKPNDPISTPLWRIAHGNANEPDPMEALEKLKNVATAL